MPWERRCRSGAGPGQPAGRACRWRMPAPLIRPSWPRRPFPSWSSAWGSSRQRSYGRFLCVFLQYRVYGTVPYIHHTPSNTQIYIQRVQYGTVTEYSLSDGRHHTPHREGRNPVLGASLDAILCSCRATSRTRAHGDQAHRAHSECRWNNSVCPQNASQFFAMADAHFRHDTSRRWLIKPLPAQGPWDHASIASDFVWNSVRETAVPAGYRDLFNIANSGRQLKV